MARKRPGDDAVGDRPEDEVYEDAIADGDVPDDDVEPDDEPVGRGGTAVRERRTSSESPTAKREILRSGVFGRIGGFVREIIAELRKVIWPTRKELLTYTGVVIAFVAVVTAIVALLDYGFAKAVLFSFGN
ncbi:MAG TPA: preprotein translocase subunit SecE [Actinoplanes sp.]|nr:preprotein translocase subunit SecE [Actinoplanes sp.]